MDQKSIVLDLRMKGMTRCHPRRSCTYAWEERCGILDGDQICSQRSVFRPKGSHSSPPEAPDVEPSPVDEAIFTVLAEFSFPFPFRLCASFRGGSVFRDPPCTSTGISTGTNTGTSRNHFDSLHRATSSMGPPRFDRGTEADSGPDGNRTIAGPLGAKCKVRASGSGSGTTLSPWTSRGFIYLFVQ
jgi:hypothetical protein